MIFAKASLFVLLLSICMSYMYISRDYYIYCTISKKENNYLIKNEIEFYSQLCHGVFKDYSNNLLMKYSIELFYSNIFDDQIELSPYERNEIQKFADKLNPIETKNNLRILKFVHFIFYLLNLYMTVVQIPKILIDILLYFLDKLQYIFLIIFILEGILNAYFDYNFNLMGSIFKLFSYLPFNYFNGIIENFFKLLF